MSRYHFLLLTLGVAFGVLVLDQLSKVIAVAWLSGRYPVEVLGPWLRLVLVRNPGAAFSIGGGYAIIFSLLAIVISIVIVRSARTLGSAGWAAALGGLLGGAMGNLTDRLLRAPGPLRGYVVDFIQIPHWPVFNVADIAIVCSAITMVILALRGIGLDGSRHRK